jgi:hypothetical protein
MYERDKRDSRRGERAMNYTFTILQYIKQYGKRVNPIIYKEWNKPTKKKNRIKPD